ncbi:SusD/RagB family nutrient-binding outer membrane lipoprotein [Flammeovirgaceae bacterium SG7u.111]|nr:SusD/RagB family nutrient-binding outer membrane lipoprotein [Flammeovirgaceae bacterium SG7u.132]WPO35134.1 SusD/RagB family nutrient-binding outer membrane lipoprotein [Flammeovirgaceae bacterium SG7u.111]
MKKIFIYAVLIFVSFSCESLVEDLNDDPNNPTDAPASLIFTGVQLANVTTHEGLTARLAAMWTSQMKGVDRQWGDFQAYNVGGSNFNNMWDNIYYGTLRNADIVLSKVEPQGLRVFAGIVKVTKAHCIGNATSLWGDIPFTQAAQIELYESPEFDAQLDIYTNLQNLLDEAITDLETGVGIPTVDIYYSGDPEKWIEAAYTLKARFYMDNKQYALAAEAAAKGISEFGNSMYVPHGTTNDVDLNMYWDFLGPSRGGDIAAEDDKGVAYLVSLLDPASDSYRGNAKTDETARFRYYYLLADEAVNTPGKIEPNTASVSLGNIRNGFFAQNASFPLITYQENVLTMAETSLRSGSFEDGLMYLNEYRAFLNEGGYIDATYQADFDLVYEPFVAVDFEAGGIENPDGLSASDALLKEIIEERYVSFYGQTIAWNDERRVRSTNVSIPIVPNNGTELPWRFIYSQDEINGNPNVPTPVPDAFVSMPIFE